MAAGLVLTIENDGPLDALAELLLVVERLRSRHGEAFRALDRRLHQIFEGEIVITPPEVHRLGDCLFTYSLPVELTECLKEARRLGVIA